MKNWIAAAAAAICVGSAADASLVFEIERINDHEARVSATGDLGGSVRQLRFVGSNSLGDAISDANSGNLTLGTSSLYNAYGYWGANDLILHFYCCGGSAIAGSSLITLTETWASVGTTGTVRNAANYRPVATYRIVAQPLSVSAPDTGPGTGDPEGAFAPVPLPAGLPLLAAGLGALGLVRRKRT